MSDQNKGKTSTSSKYITPQDLEKFKHEFGASLEAYLNEKLQESSRKIDAQLKELKALIKENNESSTEYDFDNDVIMKSKLHLPIHQVPEPGFFTGNSEETELFCELCYATFRTEPNNLLPEATKINFVQSRLRDSARVWYKIKYKDGKYPVTMIQLLNDLSKAFPNITNIKLSKLQLLELRQQYGKICDYIEKFREYSRSLDLEDNSLTLLFLNGLHPKYKEEIIKADILPDTLEEIVTKSILFENSLKVNNKINNKINNHNNSNDSNNIINNNNHNDSNNINNNNNNNGNNYNIYNSNINNDNNNDYVDKNNKNIFNNKFNNKNLNMNLRK